MDRVLILRRIFLSVRLHAEGIADRDEGEIASDDLLGRTTATMSSILELQNGHSGTACVILALLVEVMLLLGMKLASVLARILLGIRR